jgi:hypothetical protein
LQETDARAAAALPGVQRIMSLAYGKPPAQTGYTDGHYCLTQVDKDKASGEGASLLYGEILPSGVTKLLDGGHLQAATARVLIDLGMVRRALVRSCHC